MLMQPIKVILSTTDHENYSFYAPLTVRFWTELVGMRPHLVMVGDLPRWSISDKLRLIMAKCNEAGAIIHFAKPVEGQGECHVAQMSRLYGCTLDGILPHDILMTGDVDMCPLSKSFFTIMDSDAMNLYGSNFYGGQRCPMNYVAAKASFWRNMLQIPDGATLDEMIAKIVWVPGRQWDLDEDTLEAAIIRIGGKKVCARRDREGSRHGYAPGRVDRGRWVYNGIESGLVDAHLPRPGYIEENWARVRPLIADYLPQSLSWADDYHRAYMRL